MQLRVSHLVIVCACTLAAGCKEPGARVLRFEATPASLPVGGGDVVLTWETADGSGVVIQPGDLSVPESGSRTVKVAKTTEFNIYVSGLIGTSGQQAMHKAVRVEVETISVAGTVVNEDG